MEKKATYKNSKVHEQFKTIQRSRKERNLFTFDGYRKGDIFSRYALLTEEITKTLHL